MSTLEQTLAKIREQVETFCDENYSKATAGQRQRLFEKLQADIGPESLQLPNYATNAAFNLETMQRLVTKDASLAREAPSPELVYAYKLADLEKASEAPADPSTRLNLKRQIDQMTPDELLAAVPADYKKPVDDSAAPAVSPSPTKPLPNGAAAMTDEDISQIVGKPVYALNASDRSRVLAAAKHVPLSVPHDAKSADQLSRLDRELTPVEKITAFRLAQKKAS